MVKRKTPQVPIPEWLHPVGVNLLSGCKDINKDYANKKMNLLNFLLSNSSEFIYIFHNDTVNFGLLGPHAIINLFYKNG